MDGDGEASALAASGSISNWSRAINSRNSFLSSNQVIVRRTRLAAAAAAGRWPVPSQREAERERESLSEAAASCAALQLVDR